MENIVDFQISNNQMVIIKECKINLNTIEKALVRFPYKGQKRIKDNKVEHFRLPSIAEIFYGLVFGNRVPSPEDLCDGYLRRHFYTTGKDTCRLKNSSEEFSIEGVKGRVYRAYPSLIRDLHFYFLCKDSGMFDDVHYSLAADAYDGIDLTITHTGVTFAIALFVSTARSKQFKSKKYRRHEKLTMPEICIEIDPFNKAFYIGDYALYQKEHLDFMVQQMNTHHLMKLIEQNGGEIITLDLSKSTSFNPFENTRIDEINKENQLNFIQTLVNLGFDGEEDFYRHVASVDFSLAEKLSKFQTWLKEDGTKAGLIAI